MKKDFLCSGLIVSTICCFLFVSGLFAKESEEKNITGKVEGQIHANWHVDLKEEAEPLSAFDLTRAYFGYKLSINKKFTGRVMLDVGRVNEITSVSVDTAFETETKTDPRYKAYLKYGYFEVKGVIPKTSIIFGLHGLSQFKYQEKFWNYRYIYKSFMDKYKYGSSADLGMSIKVKPVDILAVNFSVINGEGYKKPQDIDGKYKTALGTEIHIIKGLSTYLYGDIMPYEELENQFTVAGFIGYKLKKIFRIGAEYNYQGNHKGVEDSNLQGVSAYTTGIIKKVDIFARVDIFSSSDWENIEKKIIGGVQYAPIKNIKICPNFQILLPSDSDADAEPLIFINGIFKF